MSICQPIQSTKHPSLGGFIIPFGFLAVPLIELCIHRLGTIPTVQVTTFLGLLYNVPWHSAVIRHTRGFGSPEMPRILVGVLWGLGKNLPSKRVPGEIRCFFLTYFSIWQDTVTLKL